MSLKIWGQMSCITKRTKFWRKWRRFWPAVALTIAALVVLATQDRLGYGTNFQEAMTSLFGEAGNPPAQGGSAAPRHGCHADRAATGRRRHLVRHRIDQWYRGAVAGMAWR